jgi:hypothetical protein
VNCTCHKDIEAKLLEKFKEREPAARNHRATLLGYGVNFATGGLSQAAQIEYDAVYPLKKGGEKAKTTKGHMVFNYCPFCGEKR